MQMSNSILSLYRIFFIDENHKLWAVVQDNRSQFMKDVPPFACFSSDRTLLTGITLENDQTAISWVYADFQNKHFPPVLACSGYCYYPALLNTPHAKVAILRADLLSPHGTGELVIFNKARKKYHQESSFQVSFIPPFFAQSGALFYVAVDNTLIKKTLNESQVLHTHTKLFTLNGNEDEFAVYADETIRWVSFKQGMLRQFIAFDVTALGFNQTGDTLFFATYKAGSATLYQYHIHTQEIALVLHHPTKITTISF